jgi:hypothetical protein
MYMIYASEVAGAIGKHQYQHPSQLLMTLWKRYQKGQHYLAAKVRCNKTTTQHDTREETRQFITKKLSDNTQFQKNCSTETLETLIRQETSEAKVTEMVQELPVNVSTREVTSLIRDSVSGHFGRVREVKSIEALGSVHENNAQFFCKSLNQVTGISLGGRIDGFHQGQLIEIKNRKSRFMTPLPLYDIIQVHCYMYLLDLKECVIVEHCNSAEKKTSVPFDASLWEGVVVRLLHFMSILDQLIHNVEWQDRVLECQTPDELEAVYYYFKTTSPRCDS